VFDFDDEDGDKLPPDPEPKSIQRINVDKKKK